MNGSIGTSVTAQVKKIYKYNPATGTTLVSLAPNVAKVTEGVPAASAPASSAAGDTQDWDDLIGGEGNVSTQPITPPPAPAEAWYKKYWVYELTGVLLILAAIIILLFFSKKKEA